MWLRNLTDGSTGLDRYSESGAASGRFSSISVIFRAVIRMVLVVSLATASVAATVPFGCIGSTSLGTFQLSVRPFSKGSPLPLKSVSAIPGGAHLVWNPLHLTPQAYKNAEVAAVLVPVSDGDLITLEPRKAGTRTEWQLPDRPQVIALIFGPQGLSEGKIKSLVTRNQELLKQLANYAEQSSQVETLVQELADAEQLGGGADAALRGFSSQYGVDLPKLNTKTSSDQQAVLLMKTLLPASNTYDPLATRSAQAQESGGLAASVAGLFFGNPVGLAAGGAALFQNLKTAMFPGTEFRSAFALTGDKDAMALCTKNPGPKSKTQTAYLWAYSTPQLKKPVVSLAGIPHLPLGSKSTVALKLGKGSIANELGRARDWRLTPVSGGASIPVAVRSTSEGLLEIDLSKASLPAGEDQLAATWDWDPLTIAGTVHLHPYGDFTHVTLAPSKRDKLIEGNGKVAADLIGADFEFLEKIAFVSSAGGATPVELGFTLPLGKRSGPQSLVTINVDTAKQGAYRLLLTQSDGVAHEVPVTIQPPNPKFSNLPIHINIGETREAIHLQGTGLERIDAVSTDAGEVSGGPDSHGWSGELVLKAGLAKGQRFPLRLKVNGLDNPVTVPDALEIVGPRPSVLSVRKSMASALGIEINADELPAGTTAGLVLTVSHLRDASRPRLQLDCESGELRHALTLAPGESSGGASLAFAGSGTLYLSVDPGTVGYADCRLAATVLQEPEGRSDLFVLGRVIRVPHLDKFTLTTERVGDSSYAGILEGRDLDVIEKAGWDAQHGVPFESIPTPVPGDPARQSLRLVLPWPAPGPHAPLYVWLRGEQAGRKTAVAY
jgi:hypothetical protein